MVSAATNFTNIDREPEAQSDVVVPEDRVYVFYPEGPEDYVIIGGTTQRQFRNGRLLSDLDKLSPVDLQWLAEQRRRGSQEPKFIMWQGDPRNETALADALRPRVTKVCQTKAAAQNAGKIVDDIEFQMAVMLAVASERPALVTTYEGQMGMYRQIAALQPSAVGSEFAMMERREAEKAQDDEVLEQALADAGSLDDTPEPPSDSETGPAAESEFEPAPAPAPVRTMETTAEPEPQSSGSPRAAKPKFGS